MVTVIGASLSEPHIDDVNVREYLYVYIYGSTVTRIYCTAVRILLQKRNVVRIALSTQLTLYGKEKQRACVELDLY